MLEWVLAAIWANHTPQSFRELEGEEQAEIVAAYETKLQIDAVMAADNAREIRRAGKKGRNP